MACLLQPIGTCAEYLNVMRFSAFLSQAEKKTLTYVTEIADNELKQKVSQNKLSLNYIILIQGCNFQAAAWIQAFMKSQLLHFYIHCFMHL